MTMNNNQIDKIEVKYQSKFELYIGKVKIFILSIIKPFIAIAIILLSIYIFSYVVLILLVFFLLLYLYNKVKNSIK